MQGGLEVQRRRKWKRWARKNMGKEDGGERRKIRMRIMCMVVM